MVSSPASRCEAFNLQSRTHFLLIKRKTVTLHPDIRASRGQLQFQKKIVFLRRRRSERPSQKPGPPRPAENPDGRDARPHT
ncbi:hypothetical protein SKAU_G00124510 [Synaphobranchus kaupii]|uniref:Uncharacterized protein n=1 Tax=Synaphobranchus kaupii TaxID=118154 RepID=A0A9Q1J2U9_SYNKA|nr:hypothetical protein SKAU_G00124510 [Synaphobranchus kaupii]